MCELEQEHKGGIILGFKTKGTMEMEEGIGREKDLEVGAKAWGK
jgi:hypothetical protein